MHSPRRAAFAILSLPLLALMTMGMAPARVQAANSARIAITPVVQQHPLDCEAAALSMALASIGVSATQDQLLHMMGADLRPPVLTNGNPTRWGDPYQTFVGNVDGQFVTTGYGVYYPPVVAAAQQLGAAATGGEGWQTASLYAAVAAGHPVLVWAPHLMRTPSVGQWTAWDGRSVWYSHSDHTQVLIGYDTDAATVTVADPLDGQIHTYSMSVFESAFAAFHRMAVIVTTAGLSVSEAISPTNGSVNVAAMGPSHSLYFYWNIGGRWNGPLGLNGANTTFSAPVIVSEGDGNFDIAVEGPQNTLWVYWDISGTWYGPYQVAAAGSTRSTPSIVVDQNNHVVIAVHSPNDGIYVYWCIAGQWYGPTGLGSHFSPLSTPVLTLGTAPATLQATTLGANSEIEHFQQNPDTSWSAAQALTGADAAYSAAPGLGSSFLFQGPTESLSAVSPGQPVSQIAPAGDVYSLPAVGASGASLYAVAEGPSRSLYYYWKATGWNGPLQVAGAGLAYSAPAMAVQPNGTINVAVEGPSDTLYFFWNIGGHWSGPLQVGAPGTTFSSIP